MGDVTIAGLIGDDATNRTVWGWGEGVICYWRAQTTGQARNKNTTHLTITTLRTPCNIIEGIHAELDNTKYCFNLINLQTETP